METSTAIRIENLTKEYPSGTRALDGVDLELPGGSVLALLGPNGAGKTTMVSILAGMVQPTSGSVAVLGLDPRTDGKQLRTRIGITFQETLLDEALTGRQVLDFHGRLYGLRRSDRTAKVDELLALMELEQAAERKVKTYSGGMKRRLEIARSIMTDPEILFIDEPTLGVDPQTRERIWGRIREMNETRDITILFTTHYMEEAEEIARQVAIIDGGKIVRFGAPQELISQLGRERIAVSTPDVDRVDADDLGALDGVLEVSPDGDRVDLSVTDSSSMLAPIARYFDAKDLRIESIRTNRPSLGEVFLSVTGRELRD